MDTEGLSAFGVRQYHAAGETSGVSGPTAMPQQYLNAPYPPLLEFTTDLGPWAAASSYATEEPTFPQATGVGPPDQGQREWDRYDRFYRQYQKLLRETNTNTSRGKVVEATDSLIEMSKLILGNVESLSTSKIARCFSAHDLPCLGLTKDDDGLYEERLEFWKHFNHCYLALLTRQLDNSRRVRESGQPLAEGETALSKDDLENLGNELIGLDDGLQATGLIDYQMGVWEEEIVDSKQIIVT